MKLKHLFTALFISAITTITYAQPGGGGQQGGQQGPPALPTSSEIEEMVSDLASEILLSDEQEATVLDLYIEHFEAVESKTSSGRPDRDEMDALKEEFETSVNEVLTSDQQKLYKAYLKKNEKKQGGGSRN